MACLPPLTATALPPLFLPLPCSAAGQAPQPARLMLAGALRQLLLLIKELLVHALLPACVAPVSLPALLHRAHRELGEREGGCSLSRPLQLMHDAAHACTNAANAANAAAEGAVAPLPNSTFGAPPAAQPLPRRSRTHEHRTEAVQDAAQTNSSPQARPPPNPPGLPAPAAPTH